MKPRSTLKAYFKKGAIPKESDFADLIDSMLVQDEDNLFKPPNDPLSIKATGAEEALLNFYRDDADGQTLRTWQIKQQPGEHTGLSIHYDGGDSRLFIDRATGNIGMGTTAPAGQLQVVGPRSFDSSTILHLTNGATDHGRTNLVLTGRFNAGNDAWNFGTAARNAIVFAKNANAADTHVGGLGDQQFSIQLEGNSNSLGFLTAERKNNPALTIKQDGNIGIGTNDPKAKLTISGDLIRRVAVATGIGPTDGTNNGQIRSRVLTFTKHYNDTAIRILYCDSFRVRSSDSARDKRGSARWEIRINGNSVNIYQDVHSSDGNYHFPATIIGYASSVSAGTYTIGVWVSPMPGYLADVVTGWNNARWTLEAQEVWL